MPTLRRRWQSIDRKLPLLASGLVLLTALVLGFSAYALLQKALVDATGRRLFSSATLVAQMLQRPAARPDSATRATHAALLAFVRGTVSRDSAISALRHVQSPMDTSKVYGALLDQGGKVIVAYERAPVRVPSWPAAAIARGEMSGDTASLGPIESLDGIPAFTVVQPLRDTVQGSTPVRYVVDTRIIVGQGAKPLRGIIGNGVQLVIGQPGVGAWTDLETIAPAPPEFVRGDTIIESDEHIAAAAKISGTKWMVWLSQPKRAVLAPARTLLFTLVPIGLFIALVSAAIMWRMAHHITHPIVNLTRAVEGVAKDANAMPVAAEMPEEVRDSDEVIRLRYAFDQMAARVAEREALELQLRHAQKMEAVGRLAGGIAHDFNNLLTAIRSYADLMIDDMPEWDAKRGDVEEIRKAAHRASQLTAQLLAFSRKQLLQPRVLDIAVVLTEVQGMLQRLLIEDIRLSMEAPSGLWLVKVDRGQLEQVIVNLAVNARDAMPNGGALRIRASNEEVPKEIVCSQGNVPPGDYVAIRLTDTGVGMDEATQSRLFEPFFTTKAVGQGTGLGLATVHGIIAQSGGCVTFESALGTGTTFTVYLPKALEALKKENGVSSGGLHGQNETILLVEDETSVRSLARRVLVRAGFRVLESTTPSHALRLAREHAGEIDLVLSDVVMPEMNGPAMVARIAQICPRARVLYISGYTDDEVISRGLANPGLMLLQKPFSAQQLVERVRAAIDVS